MKKQILFFTLFLGLQFSQAQDLSFEWGYSLGGILNERPSNIVIDNDGNIYVLGNFVLSADLDPTPNELNVTTPDGFSDFFIQKLSPDGNLIWAKSFGGLGDQRGETIAINDAGEIYISGWFFETIVFDFQNGEPPIELSGFDNSFFLKLDTNGNFIWAKQIGEDGRNRFFSSKVDDDGNLFITGYFRGTMNFNPNGNNTVISNGEGDGFVLKLNNLGDFIWVATLGGDDEVAVDIILDIDFDLEGNLLLVGEYHNTTDFDPGPNEFLLTTINSASHAFMLKLSQEGNFISVLGSPRPTVVGSSSIIQSIDVDQQGNIYLTGTYINTNNFDPENGVFLLTSLGAQDIFRLKLDPNGNFIWANSIGAGSIDLVYNIFVDNQGNNYIAGRFGGVVDFDPGAGVLNIESSADVDGFIQKLDPNGNLVWVQTFGGELSTTSRDIKLYNNNLYTFGTFQQEIDLDPSENEFIVSSNGIADIFFAKYNDNTLTVDEINDAGIKIYPNPTNTNFYISNITEPIISLKILNASGVLVKEISNPNLNNQVQVNLSSGVYYLTIENREGTYAKKLLIK